MKTRLARVGLWAGLWALVLAALLTVFAAYLNPHLVFELASRAWACF